LIDDAGFWAAFITWFTLGIGASLVGLILHMREKNRTK
jgi:hypothetical protein